MSKALIIGIDHYANPADNLNGAVIDARNMLGLLSRNENDSPNFECVLVVSAANNLISKANLRRYIRELFAGRGDIALLYFAGHGSVEDTGGYICPSDSLGSDDGVPVADIMTWANQSEYNNRVIILDSCHSGAVGTPPGQRGFSEIAEGVTILTASTEKQTAGDTSGGGVFTNLLIDALEGSACNLLGEITPGSIYAHIDQSLGEFGQRPMFKTNVQKFIALRRVIPPINPDYLRRILELFPSRDYFFALDPTFEPERNELQLKDKSIPAPNPVNTAIFAILQDYVKVGLLRPVDQPHMWHAAMNSTGARLTRLGEHYRELAERGKL